MARPGSGGDLVSGWHAQGQGAISLADGTLRGQGAISCITRLGREIVFSRFWPESVEKAGSIDVLKGPDRRGSFVSFHIAFVNGFFCSESFRPSKKSPERSFLGARSVILSKNPDPAFSTDSGHCTNRHPIDLRGKTHHPPGALPLCYPTVFWADSCPGSCEKGPAAQKCFLTSPRPQGGTKASSRSRGSFQKRA